tara:strand:- start:582 stop:1184 length:603 start_codon:yes stop_codon:yes gene_type:complete
VVYRLDTPGVENQAITNAKIDTGAVSTQKVDASINNALVPINGIIMYSGLQADIPANWAICDGNNGTPNLVNKFVVAAASFDVGTEEWRTSVDGTSKESGGAATKTLGTNELPAHTHEKGTLAVTGGDHNHTYDRSNVTTVASGGSANTRNQGVTETNTGDSGDLTLTVSGSTGNQSGTTGEAFDILPPFYAIAYIMRVS